MLARRVLLLPVHSMCPSFYAARQASWPGYKHVESIHGTFTPLNAGQNAAVHTPSLRKPDNAPCGFHQSEIIHCHVPVGWNSILQTRKYGQCRKQSLHEYWYIFWLYSSVLSAKLDHFAFPDEALTTFSLNVAHVPTKHRPRQKNCLKCHRLPF